LAEALVRWADLALVEAVKAQERRLTEFQMGYFVHRPLLSDVRELRQTGRDDWMIGPPDFGPLIAAWRRLERDLITRLDQRQLYVRGVPLRPVRGTRHEPLPGIWAASFELSFTDNTIRMGDALYGAIEVARTEFAVSTTRADPPDADVPPMSASEQVDAAEGVDADLKPPGSRRPGPGSFDGMIDQAMERHWDVLCDTVARRGKDPPNWSEMARVLRKLIEKESRGDAAIDIPGHQVIRKRMAVTYPKLLVRMSGKI
jgi:hypothetical protein